MCPDRTTLPSSTSPALTQFKQHDAEWQRAKRESNCSITSTSAGMITRYHSHVNLLGGSPLNHLSWLRPSTNFLCAALTASTTRWVIFCNGKPLVDACKPQATPGSESNHHVEVVAFSHVSTSTVQPILGPDPVFGQGKEIAPLPPR